MSKQKKSKAVPVVVILTVLFAALCAACIWGQNYFRNYTDTELARQQEAVEKRNAEKKQIYDAEVAEYQRATSASETLIWPAHKSDGWDVLDLTNYPLENATTATLTRADLLSNSTPQLNTGMLLINPWHARPDDFDESKLVGLGNYFSWKVQVENASVSLFPVAADALKAAIDDAEAAGMTHYLVSEGYRSWDTQNSYFQNKVEKLKSKYANEEALYAAAKKDVSYPGTSEYNSGLSFTLRLYDKNDSEVGKPKYSTTEPGKWMNENCWKYGLIFRFPLNNWPLEGTTDKSFKTGISGTFNLYRYVGKGNAAIMHYMDLCLEEYIEYLCAHPHIALFVDGQLKYEVYRQYVGEADSFPLLMTSNSYSSESSLDNMGGVVTVFSY